MTNEWERLNKTHADTVSRFSVITRAASECSDAAFFEHLADILHCLKSKPPFTLTNGVWFQYEAAYIASRYRVNGIQSPSAEETRGRLELEWEQNEYKKMGVANCITDLRLTIPALPNFREIEEALALPKTPTVGDVCRSLSSPLVLGPRLAERYKARAYGPTIKQRESLETQIRRTCSELRLPLKTKAIDT